MSEQFENAMKLAMDAFNANNEEECKSFCNQALTVDPSSANAKALKGAAVLISFSLAGAASDAEEALSIWESIPGTAKIDDKYAELVIEAAFEFRARYSEAAKAHYKEFKEVKGADNDFDQAKRNCITFMNRFSAIPALENSVVFANSVRDLLKKYLDEGIVKTINTEMPFVRQYVNRNKDRTDEVGVIVKDISANLINKLDSLQKKTTIVKVVFGLVIAAVVIILIAVNQ